MSKVSNIIDKILDKVDKNYKIRGFIKTIKDLKFEVKYRCMTHHQYHVVYTDLPPSYYDVDTVMLHSNMKLLCRYVENECGGRERLVEKIGWIKEELTNPSSPNNVGLEGQLCMEAEALAIYDWWTKTRIRDKELEKQYSDILYGYHSRYFSSNPSVVASARTRTVIEEQISDMMESLGNKINKDEDEMLIRLMKIRRSLWT